ncbi:ankyrin repeat-containing domain protein [Trichoderma chlorosporum]
MSVGLDVNFFAVISLVNQVRKSFVGAPEQFKAISDDVRGFSIVLQDVEASYAEFSSAQSQAEYQDVLTSCKHLLEQLKKTLDEYSGVAKGCNTGKTAIKRVWKRLKWEPDDIRDIRSQISIKIAVLKNLNDQVTNHSIVKLLRHQEDTERETTLKWISDVNYVAQQNDIVLRCQTGSRRWLFESAVYLEWCKRKGSLLFCPGNAGTGKTFTTAMVIESLRLVNDAEAMTAYMYCTYQNHTQTIEKLLCSLIRVALEEADHEADGIVSTCSQLRSSNKILSRQLCLDLLQRLFSGFTRVNLVVDALDELSNDVRRPLIYDLLKLHKHGNVSLFVTSRGIPEIQHLFEGSEVYTSLEVRSSDEDIRNFLRDNIFQLPNFVTRSQKLQDEVISSITSASAGMFLLAELYLKSLASIISVGSLRTRLSNLATGSNAYDALYEDAMLRIGFQGPESERIAVQMLLVLTCARRPLSPQELSHALSIDEDSEAFDEDMVPDMDDLVAACTGLVVLDDTSNIVHLVHKSAAEYFERTRSRWFPKASEKMAFICLRYLQVAETMPKEIRHKEAPFFNYAKANWSYHSMEGEREATSDIVVDDTTQISQDTNHKSLSNEAAFTRLAIQQMTKEVVDVHSSIVEACHAGHQAWVEQLLVVRQYDMNRHSTRPETFISEDGSLKDNDFPMESFQDNVLLTIAAARGDYSMVQMLLARGADPNIFNAAGQTPLIIAAANGFDNLVSLLLDQKSIKLDLIGHHCGRLSTAFLASVQLGKQECFRLLIERSDLRATDSYKRGAMWLAADSGHASIVSELLKWPDVEIEYSDTGFCGSPLMAALRCGHEEAALFLVPHTKGQSCSRCGVSSIYYAVQKGLHSVLERLLEHDASAVDHELDIHSLESVRNSRDFPVDCLQDATERTRTPLLTAIDLRDVQATQILLLYADVNRGLTWRPLHAAAEWGNIEIFELFLKKANLEPDPVNDLGQTPFLIAAQRGNCDIMKALIQHGGIQFNRRDADGRSADSYIIKHFQNLDYFRLLATVWDIDVNKKDSRSSSLLHQACQLRPEARHVRYNETNMTWVLEMDLLELNAAPLVNELLKRPGVDVNLRDGSGMTPLLLAVKNHQRDVVRLLLDREDIDVLAQDEEGNDALGLASFYEPICEGLFSHFPHDQGIDRPVLKGLASNRPKVENWTEALNAEFKEYDESIFSMLLHDKRTDSHHRNKRGQSIAVRVAMAGTRSMVQTVLETAELASDLETVLPGRQTLLCRAIKENPDDDAVDLLIAHYPAAVLEKADAKGRTPLSYAVERATAQTTRSLLIADVDINVADKSGEPPLCHAIGKLRTGSCCLLIAVEKTRVNAAVYHRGKTALSEAAILGNVPVMSALLERPDIDVVPIDEEGHSFLCDLMMSSWLKEDELGNIIPLIHHHLQLHVRSTRTFYHNPFICPLERRFFFRTCSFQCFAMLSEYFLPGLDLARCATRAGLLEILGEVEGSDDNDRELCLRAFQLYDGLNNQR